MLADVTSAFGVALPERGRESGIAMQRRARFIHRQGHDEKLQIGAFTSRIFRACRAADLPCADGQRTFACKEPVHPHLG